jgi:hypothetical protein
MLPLGSVTLLSAASGTGKTWVAYAIAGAVARGTPFLGREVRQRPVLYLDGENPLAIVQRNLEGLGVAETPTLQVWGGWNDAPASAPPHGEILEFARQHEPLLIWDSLVEFHPGDEQSSTETRKFMKHFRALAHAGATVLVLHHTGKTAGSKEYRGSSDIAAAVDMAYKLEGQPKDRGLYRLIMRNFKSRFAQGRDFGMEFQAGRGFQAIEVVQQAARLSADAVVAEIISAEPGLNGQQIKARAKERGVGKRAVERALAKLPSRSGKGKEKLYFPPEEAMPAEEVEAEEL